MPRLRHVDIQDPGKEAVLSDPGTRFDDEKGWVLFKCQGCRELVHERGVEIPTGGLCMICSGRKEDAPHRPKYPDGTDYSPGRSYPTIWETDLEKRKERLEEQRTHTDEAAADLREYAEWLAKREQKLNAWGKELEKRKERLDKQEIRVREVREVVYADRGQAPRLRVPAWARDALWGMGLSGIGLAFAWVATQIF